MARTKCAVVGCGYWGPNLIRNLQELPSAELAILCDRDEARLKTMLARCPGAKGTSRFEDVLEDATIEAVILATPAETHASMVDAALRAGKNTFVEKPLALTRADCYDLIETAKETGRTLMVGHTFLYNDAVQHLRGMIEENELGDVCYVHARRLNLGKIRRDCNAMWNLAPHDVSIILHLFQERPHRVMARGYNFLGQKMQDYVTMTLEFPSGKVGFIDVSWLSPHKVRDVTVVGSTKMALYDDVSPDAKITVYDKGVESGAESGNFGEFQLKLRFGDVHIPHIRMREPLNVELGHFVECCQTGKTPISDGKNGLDVVEVLEAAQKSLEQDGTPVSLRPRLAVAAA